MVKDLFFFLRKKWETGIYIYVYIYKFIHTHIYIYFIIALSLDYRRVLSKHTPAYNELEIITIFLGTNIQTSPIERFGRDCQDYRFSFFQFV